MVIGRDRVQEDQLATAGTAGKRERACFLPALPQGDPPIMHIALLLLYLVRLTAITEKACRWAILDIPTLENS